MVADRNYDDEEKESEIAKYAIQGAPKTSEKKINPEEEKRMGLIQTIIIIILIIIFAAILYYLLTNFFEIKLPS